MTKTSQPRAVSRRLRLVAAGTAFTVEGVLLMLWLAGVFRPKIDSSVSSAPPPRPLGRSVVEVRAVRRPNIESAVGTIRAVHEAAVASKLLARVVEVRVQAGQAVHKDDILVRLDDADLTARLQQAEAAVAAATAARDQAQVEFDRVENLKKLNQSAPIEFERVQAALKAAQADLIRVEQARTEAQTILEYATIRSPIDGTVIDKRVEAGDTAQPGQVLLNLYDPTSWPSARTLRSASRPWTGSARDGSVKSCPRPKRPAGASRSRSPGRAPRESIPGCSGGC